MEHTVVRRPAENLSRSNPSDTLRQLFQVKSIRCTFYRNHGDFFPVPFHGMAQQKLLSSVKTIHADHLDLPDILMFTGKPLQKTQERCFARAGRRGKHCQNAAPFFRLQSSQFSQQRQENLIDFPFAVYRFYIDSVYFNTVSDHFHFLTAPVFTAKQPGSVPAARAIVLMAVLPSAEDKIPSFPIPCKKKPLFHPE